MLDHDDAPLSLIGGILGFFAKEYVLDRAESEGENRLTCLGVPAIIIGLVIILMWVIFA